MNQANSCECSAAPTLIFACSGAADVGEIADLVARRLTQEGAGKMFCLAGVGGRVDPILETTQAAKQIVALDGCPLDCVRQTLELASIANFQHLRVTDLGMKKGESAATPEVVAQVAQKTRSLMRGNGSGGS